MTVRAFIFRFWIASLVYCVTTMVHAAPVIQHWQAASGVQVHFVEIRTLPVIDIAVEFRAGNSFDAPGKEGLARLTHVLLTAGSRRFDEAAQSRRLADVGATVGDNIDRDRSGYHLRTLSSLRERTQAVETLADMLQQPVFPADILMRERERLASNTREELTRPEALVLRHLLGLMYADHPYGRLATDTSITGLARVDVESFYRAHYTAPRTVVTLVGDLSRDDARQIAEVLTSLLPKDNADASLPPVRPSAARLQRVPHPSGQSHILLGVPTIASGDRDFFPLYVGNHILGGGGFVSRLYEQVREKRALAYSVYSSVVPLARPGPFLLGLQTEKKQTDQALATVRSVLEEFVARGPTTKELQAAKRSLTGGFPLRIDSNRAILNEVAHIAFYRLPRDWLDRFVPNIEAVTAAQIQQAFARHIDKGRLATVVVGAPE